MYGNINQMIELQVELVICFKIDLSAVINGHRIYLFCNHKFCHFLKHKLIRLGVLWIDNL